MAEAFAQHFSIPFAVAQRDLGAILQEWRQRGVIGTRRPHQPRGDRHATVDAGLDCALPLRSAETWQCTIRGFIVAFSIERNHDLTFVRALFQHLETADTEPQIRIEVRSVGAGEMQLVVDGSECMRTPQAGLLAGALYQAVLERIFRGADWLALIHGGAVTRGGLGFGFAAPSGSGKSTLIAYLITQGFDYLADDLMALAGPDGRIVPWPMPLSLKHGSWEVLSAVYPDLAHFPRYRTKGMDARLLIPPAGAWHVEPPPLRALLFPTFVPGAAAELRRIDPFAALERLLRDRVWLGYPIIEQRVLAAVRWLEATPAYTLVYGRLDQGAQRVRGLAV